MHACPISGPSEDPVLTISFVVLDVTTVAGYILYSLLHQKVDAVSCDSASIQTNLKSGVAYLGIAAIALKYRRDADNSSYAF